HELYDFGPFRLDASRRLLTRNGEVVPLTSKSLDTLLALVRDRDRVLTKEELMKTLWPDSFVEEVNLAQNVSALRKAMGESPGENLYIATIPGKGYRFVSQVRTLHQDDEAIVVERHTRSAVVIREEEGADALPDRIPALPPKEESNWRWAAALIFVPFLIGMLALYLWRVKVGPLPARR